VPEGGGTLRELAALFSIEVEDEALKRFDKKVEGLKGRIVEAGKLIVEALAVEKLKEFFTEQIEGAARLQDLSDKLGIAAEELRSFQFAAQGAGLDAETSAHLLGHLNRSIGEAVVGGGEAAKVFRELKVPPLKDAAGKVRPLADILPDVADAIAKLPGPMERTAYATKIFGREGAALVPILAQGSDKMEELYREAEELGDGLGDDYPKKAKEAREATEKFNFAMQSLKNRITAEVLPSVMRFYEWAKNIVVKIIDFDKRTHALSTILSFLAVVAGVRVYGAMRKIVEVLGLGAGGVRKFLEAFKVTGPIALLYGLYLILDDISAWARGGDSLIGRALSKFEGAKGAQDTLENLQTTLHEINDDVGAITQGFGAFLGLSGSELGKELGLWDALGLSIHGVVTVLEALYHTLAAIGSLLGGVLKGAFDVATLHPEQAAGDVAAGGASFAHYGQRIVEDFGGSTAKQRNLASGASNAAAYHAAGLDSQVGAAYAHAGIDPNFHIGEGQSAREVLAKIRASQVGGGRGGDGGKRVDQKTTINVQVQGGKDAHATGKIVGQGVATEMEKENARTLDAIVTP
jgi:hypothetical protein